MRRPAASGARPSCAPTCLRTDLERDIPQLGPRIAAETLRRFWTMLAHAQGSLLNAAALGRSLGVSGKTMSSYLNLLVDLLLVRRLQPLHANVGKRLTKAPKVYVRDSGLVHTLLGLDDREAVLGHPVAGASWEGFVLDNLLQCAPGRSQAWFYRTAAGAEMDLVLDLPGGQRWAIAIQRSSAPRLSKGFHQARADLEPQRTFVVYVGDARFPLLEGVEAIGAAELAAALRALCPAASDPSPSGPAYSSPSRPSSRWLPPHPPPGPPPPAAQHPAPHPG